MVEEFKKEVKAIYDEMDSEHLQFSESVLGYIRATFHLRSHMNKREMLLLCNSNNVVWVEDNTVWFHKNI